MSHRVIVVGSVNVDLVVAVERLPAPGETVVGGRFERHHGGKGGNQAVAAARLGALTAFVGAIGGDAFGRDARDALAADRIDLRGLACLEEATGVALILVDANGENSIAVAGGSNVALGPEHVRGALATLQPGPGDIVLVGHEIPTPVAHEALRIGRASGATTILNPAPAGGLDASTLALADILTPNRGELATLAGLVGLPADAAPVDAAVALLDRLGLRAVLVSLGADGALLVESGQAKTISAPPVGVVDSTGAGDTLNGALAAGLAEGLPLGDAAARAVRAASLATTRAGARDGMPTIDELRAAGR
ncbi:MAG: ribokinase [Chloroflexi bacterium]|nr:ribokinase [Chloroflexota bacterium]